MKKKINGVDINYIRYGKEDGKNIVLLHGWGQNIQMMQPIGDALMKNFNITILDLPGYGESTEPPYPWSVKDYVVAIHELLTDLNIEEPILMGHSFGGKISLLYASMYPVAKLVLFASPFKPEITKLSWKTKALKQLKKVPVLNKLEGFAKKHIGSTDYRQASDIMRKVLVNTVNLDITEDIRKIKCSTLIVWGTLDEAVPLKRAYELESLIKDAGVVVYENCTHYAYLENLDQTIRVLYSFLGGM